MDVDLLQQRVKEVTLDSLYDLLRFHHVMSFVFMSIPPFSLIYRLGVELSYRFVFSSP